MSQGQRVIDMYIQQSRLIILPLLNSHSNSKAMRQLHYIPTPAERQRVVSQLTHTNQNQAKGPPESENKPEKKKQLSQHELDQMLKRLTATTKREHQIEKNAENILKDNIILKRKRQEGDKVENRLIEYGKKVELKKEELGHELDREKWEREQKDVPDITDRGKKVKQKGIDKRLEDLIRERHSRRKDLEQKHKPKFTPNIDPYSQFINQLDNYGDLFTRMKEKEHQAAERQELKVKELELRQKERYTYRPEFNIKSKQIAESIPRRPVSEYKSQPKESIVSLQEGEEYPFAPLINPQTQNLLRNKENYDKNCFSRLYDQAKHQAQKKSQKSRVDKHSFKPTLNSRSLRIMSQTPKQDRSRVSVNSFEGCQQIKVGNRGTDCTKAETYKEEWDFDWKKRCMSMLNGSKGRSAARLL